MCVLFIGTVQRNWACLTMEKRFRNKIIIIIIIIIIWFQEHIH